MSQPKKRKHRPLYYALFLDVLIDSRTQWIFIYVAIVITIGAGLFRWLEGWSWLDSFYFVVITLTTIGYGDFSPTTFVLGTWLTGWLLRQVVRHTSPEFGNVSLKAIAPHLRWLIVILALHITTVRLAFVSVELKM